MEFSESMQEQYNRVMNWHIDLLYIGGDGANGVAPQGEIPDELFSDLWNFMEGFDNFLYRWLNGRGSLTWILETTPEKVQNLLDESENQIKLAYQLLDRPLPE